MKIAFLTDGIYPYDLGGKQKHSFFICKYLAKYGIHIDLYYSLSSRPKEKIPTPWFTNEEMENIRTFNVARVNGPYFPGHYLLDSYKTSSVIFNQLSKNSGVDFIYAQGLSGWKTIHEKQKGTKLPPIGVHPHGLNMFQSSPSLKTWLQNLMLKPFFQWNLRSADYALSLGGNISKLLHAIGIRKNAILLSPNGVERHWVQHDFDFDSEHRKFVFVGRYQRLKGVEELHEAIQYLISKGFEFTFHFIGPIPKNIQMDTRHIVYWGLVREEDQVKNIIAKSDILVCPSYSEGMPTVVLEAMALGRPIIATRVGAMNELVDADNGWLIRPGDVQSLVHSLKQAILLSPIQLLKMGECSQRIVTENYLWSKVAQTTIREIKRAKKNDG